MKVKLEQLYDNLLIDTALSFYMRAWQDAGQTKEQGRDFFLSHYIAPDVKQPDSIIEVYKLLQALIDR